MTNDGLKRATVYFTGHVQGVGFRYSVCEVARGYDVTGHVQNLADGRVLLVAEGRVEELDGFVLAIEERMSGVVRKTERNDEPATGQFRGFSIQ
jgi:acylphosphatase